MSKKIASEKQAIQILLLLFSLLLIFHVLIVSRIIPYSIVWSGRLKTEAEMVVFESVAILVNLFLILILLMKGDFITLKFSEKMIKGTIWLFIIFFSLNVVGNLFSENLVERLGGTLLALVSVSLLWLVVKGEG